MSQLTPAAQRWLATHHGVITGAQLRRCGVGRSTTSRFVALGVLRRVQRGVHVLTTAAQTLEQRCAVLCACHPEGFVTGPTAAMLSGLRRQPHSSALNFAVRHGVHLPIETGVRFRQTRALDRCDRRPRPDGIIVASWARLAFDLAADLRQLDHRTVIQQLLDTRRVTVEGLVAIADRLCHPARPGSTTFRRTVSTLDGQAPQDSHSEVVLFEALRAAGVAIEAQSEVLRASDGRTLHVDLAVHALRWGIELDIHPEHRSVEGQFRGAVRMRSMHASDWQIEPVSEGDLTDVRGLVTELVALYHRRDVELRRSVG